MLIEQHLNEPIVESEYRRLVADIELFAQENGLSLHRHPNIIPAPDGPYSNYSFVFMGAMQPGEENLYFGDIPEPSPPTILLSQCIRTDGGFRTAGASPRHMKSFTMLGLSGRHAHLEAVGIQYRLLEYLLRETAFSILAKVNPSDIETLTYLRDKNIAYELSQDDDCIFVESKRTDRTGKRVELIAKGSLQDGTEISWELANCVTLTHIDNGNISLGTQPIIDTGGSLERILALREGSGDVFHTSAYPYAEVNNIANTENDRVVEKFCDLVNTALIMTTNGIEAKTGRNSNQREKTFYACVREIAMTILENNIWSIDPEAIIQLVADHINIVSPTNVNIEQRNVFDLVASIQEQLGYLKERSIKMQTELRRQKRTSILKEQLIVYLGKKFDSDERLARLIVEDNIPMVNAARSFTPKGQQIEVTTLRNSKPASHQANFKLNDAIKTEVLDRRPELTVWNLDYLNQAQNDGIDKLVVSAVVTNGEGKVLVLKRSQNESLAPGEPDLPGGGVEDGEQLDLMGALERELQEELKIKDLKFIDIIGYFDIKWQSKITRQAVIWVVTNKSKFELNPHEHESYGWRSIEDTGGEKVAIDTVMFHSIGEKMMVMNLVRQLKKSKH